VTTEITVTYRSESTADGRSMYLAADSPVFFDGFATQPLPTARALALVTQVAATRFYEPASMIAARIRAADPVVTAEDGRLRFESFSRCAGVHARLDLVEDGLDVRECAPGTTNVDFNPPVLRALSHLAGSDPLRLTVGQDSVAVQTFEGTLVEHQVPLPERWVKGFGEVQVALTHTVPVLELGQTAARRFLDALPGGDIGKTVVWAIPSGAGVRIGRAFKPGAVCVAGTSRLRILQPLARFATALRAYGRPHATAPSAVAWVLTLPGGRMSLTLSPEPSRGFSGEGGLLFDLISAKAERDADELSRALARHARFRLADTRLEAERGTAALSWLGAHGHVGFDAAEQVFFWRHLPYPDDVLRADPPRLRAARELVAARAVTVDERGARVISGTAEYRVSDGRCTCPWMAKHGTARGPCKHVLATAIVDASRLEQRLQ